MNRTPLTRCLANTTLSTSSYERHLAWGAGLRDDRDGVECIERELAAEPAPVVVERTRGRAEEVVEHLLLDQVLALVLQVADHQHDDADWVEAQYNDDVDERVAVGRRRRSRLRRQVSARDVRR